MARAACQAGRAGNGGVCWDSPRYSRVVREQGKSRAQQDSETRELALNPLETPQFLTFYRAERNSTRTALTRGSCPSNHRMGPSTKGEGRRQLVKIIRSKWASAKNLTLCPATPT